MIEKVHIPLDQWLEMTPEQRAPFERQAANLVIDLDFDHPEYAMRQDRELHDIWRQVIEEMNMTPAEKDAWEHPRTVHHGGKL